MKAITLHQPYASLIIEGRKRFETRSWAFPRGLEGQRIAIHAAKLRNQEVKNNTYREYDDYPDGLTYDRYRKQPYGMVIGTAVLNRRGQVILNDPKESTIVVSWNVKRHYSVTKRIDRSECKHGDFSLFRWLWEFSDPKPIEPVEARGYQGFWNWKESQHG